MFYPHVPRRAYAFRISSPSPLFSSTVSSEAFYIQDNLVSWLLYPGNRVLDNIDTNPRVPICIDLPYTHYVTDMSGSHMLQCDKADCPRAESVNSNKMYSEESTVVGMQASGNLGKRDRHQNISRVCTTLKLITVRWKNEEATILHEQEIRRKHRHLLSKLLKITNDKTFCASSNFLHSLPTIHNNFPPN